jgi:acetyl-CoA synthetase
MVKESGECEPAVLDSEDLLFMLYTSGSTGNPKGIVHSQAGYLLYASLTHSLVFDCKEGDIFGCVADIGWITGHSYVVYGPLANGVTTSCLDFIIHLISNSDVIYSRFPNRLILGDCPATKN